MLTTGATTETKRMNIYDFAGNLSEYTLSMLFQGDSSSVAVGGDVLYGDGYATRSGGYTIYSGGVNVGFRVTLY